MWIKIGLELICVDKQVDNIVVNHQSSEAPSASLHPLPLALKVVGQTSAAKVVKQINSKYAFQEALNSVGDKLVVVDFSAMWCGPCKMITPFFHSLSEKYSNVVFLEVDVNNCQDTAAECEVKCMPTFHFFKKGQKVGEFSGANKEKLEATINELV
ncbi:thioredoxin-like [Molossus molossus]|uniref:thioredoxin-like n=1 Tax=Molossus molossus TaxID=27622 RepID=UPI001745F35E|nr:thioredoxin-like [Molossus molossus]